MVEWYGTRGGVGTTSRQYGGGWGVTSLLNRRTARLTVPGLHGVVSEATASCLSARVSDHTELTGGHHVARGPDRVGGFAVTPCMDRSVGV